MERDAHIWRLSEHIFQGLQWSSPPPSPNAPSMEPHQREKPLTIAYCSLNTSYFYHRPRHACLWKTAVSLVSTLVHLCLASLRAPLPLTLSHHNSNVCVCVCVCTAVPLASTLVHLCFASLRALLPLTLSHHNSNMCVCVCVCLCVYSCVISKYVRSFVLCIP